MSSWGESYDHGVILSRKKELAARVDAVELSAGNPDALRAYWRKAINWGAPHDMTKCIEQVSKYMDRDQAAGFCQLRHEEVLGGPNRPSQE